MDPAQQQPTIADLPQPASPPADAAVNNGDNSKITGDKPIETPTSALNTVMVRKILKHTPVDPDIASFLRVVAALPLLLFALYLSPLYPQAIRQNFTVHLFDFHLFFYVLLNSIFVALLYLFINRILKIASASYTAMMAAVTPILVTILGVAFLGESLTSIQFLGACFIILASFVTHLLKVDKH